MSADAVCRVCLVNNLNLYEVRNYLQNVYEKLTREKYNKVGYPASMCYICLSTLRKCHKFVEAAQDTENVLKQWYNNNQRNEIVARPIRIYSVSKLELISTVNEDVIKVENVDSEAENIEYDTDNIEKAELDETDIDVQTDGSDNPYNSIYRNDIVEDNNDEQTDPSNDVTKEKAGFDETDVQTDQSDSPYDSNCNDIVEDNNDKEIILNNDANINKSELDETDIDVQTDRGESSDDSNCNDIVEDINEKQTDLLFVNNMAFENIRSLSSNMDINTYVETRKEITSQDGNGAPQMKKRKTNETKPQHQTPGPSRKTVANNNFKPKILNLRGHIQTRTGEKSFSCYVCGYKCIQKGNLNLHIRKRHNVQKSTLLDPFTFGKTTFKLDLTDHKTTVTGIKPYSCDVCGYKFARRSYLTNHMRTHTGEKPFSCDICAYKCIQKWSLVYHIRRRHADQKSVLSDTCSSGENAASNGKSNDTSVNTHPSQPENDRPKNAKTIIGKNNRIKKSFLVTSTSGENAASSGTSNDTSMNTHPSQPLNDRVKKNKRKPTISLNKPIKKETSKLKKIVKKTAIQKEKKKIGTRKILKNIQIFNKLAPKYKEEINKTNTYSQNTSTRLNTDKKEHEDRYVYCKVCNIKCITKDQLARHMRFHDSSRPHVCDVCHYRFNCLRNLHAHKAAIHETCTRKDKRGVFLCDICGYKCNKKSTIIGHITKRHSHVKSISCNICDYKCILKGNLNQHLRKHTGEKPYSCYICGYRSTLSGSLKQHLRIHTGEKPYSCHICGYRCTQSGSLNIHIKRHDGVKPLSCDICGFKFVTNSSLSRHMRTHTGEKPFSCDNCSYACANKSGLKRHVRTHTGDRPHSCSVCSYTCIQKGDLIIHMRTHTGEKPFTCQVCSYKCTQRFRLKRHLLTRHNINDEIPS